MSIVTQGYGLGAIVTQGYGIQGNLNVLDLKNPQIHSLKQISQISSLKQKKLIDSEKQEYQIKWLQ
jgi:hypothetical protein